MRVVADGAGDPQIVFRAGKVPLDVVSRDSPSRQRLPTLVARSAAGGNVVNERAVLFLQRDCVGRELPFINEGMMEPTVTVGAALRHGGRVTQHRHMG